MPKLTPLAIRALVAVGLSVFFFIFLRWFVALLLCGISWVAAVRSAPPSADPKLTPMDRFMINLQRVLRGNNRWKHVAGVMHFEQGTQPSVAAAKECMEKVVLEYPRFSSLAVATPLVEDSYYHRCLTMDMDYHIQEHKLSGAAEVQRKRDELINTALDPSKPLWRFDILNNEIGPSQVILRVDHCLADGLRIVKAAGGFLFFEDGSPAELALLAKMSSKKLSLSAGRSKFNLALQVLKDLPMVLLQDRLSKEDPSCFHTPGKLFDASEDRTCVTGSVSFSDIKIIRDSCPSNTTINDVVLAAFCGALQRYAQKVGQPLKPGSLMRGLCAVSLPDFPTRSKFDTYNHFIMPSFRIPVGLPSTSTRLRAAKDAMGQLKLSLGGILTTKISYVLGRLGLDTLAGDTQLRVFPLHSFVYSNVPGMEQPVCLFSTKSRVTGFEVFYPNLVSQVIFLTYCDQMTFSLTTCTSQIKDPALLLQSFAEEVKAWREES